MSTTRQQLEVKRMAFRYASDTIVAILEGNRDSSAFEGMAATFIAGFQIGSVLALVDPDLARSIADQEDPDSIHAVAAAVETFRRSAR